MSESDDEARPSRPALGVVVGVTGHRHLQDAALPKLTATLTDILNSLSTVVEAIGRDNASAFQPGHRQMVLLSALAEGADQLVAETALGLGWGLRVVLPFAREEYARDFEGGVAARFAALLDRASASWSLPSSRSHEDEAYALAGEATAAHSEILIAVWDGENARGLGGTGEVVEYAVRRGVPVIWLASDGEGDPVILWAGFDGLSPALLDRNSAPRRKCDRESLDYLGAHLVAPPEPPEERTALETFLGEREQRWRLRIEYPLLLLATGTRPLRKSDVRAVSYAEAAQADWSDFRTRLTIVEPAAGLDSLEQAFSWSDGLANHYAQTYRGGLVFNYTAAALSVLLALSGPLLPGAGILLPVVELALIGGLIVNTSEGNRRQWHRRWLDYRYLAERLRPLRSLHLLSAATPGFKPGQQRWTEWYARALWRQLGAPPTLKSDEEVAAVADHVALHEIDSQIGYHEVNARRMHFLEHRLHTTGTFLFYSTAAVTVTELAAHLVGIHLQEGIEEVMTFLSGALPTIGAALFGLRGQADFAGAARRSQATAQKLMASADVLRATPIDMATSARATEGAANTMLSDLAEWHVNYRHRPLIIPG